MFNKPLEIRTKRLLLKPLSVSDKKDMVLLLNDINITKTYMIPDFANKEEEDGFFNRVMKLTSGDNHISYGIFLNDKVIGFINDVSINHDEIEVGYFIDSKEWNKGYASEALEAMIDILFKIGFKRIIAGYFVGNEASRRVMEKCHMTPINKEEVISYKNHDDLCKYYEIIKV